MPDIAINNCLTKLPVTCEAVSNKEGEVMSVVEILQWIIEEICDNYCKWPEQYRKKYKNEDEAVERLLCEKCDKCCLNKLC